MRSCDDPIFFQRLYMVVTLVHASGRVVLCPPHSELVHPSSYLSSDHTRLSIIKTFIASTIFPEADSFSSHVGAVQISRFTPGSTYEKLAELECDTAMTMPIDAAKGLGMSTDSLSPFQTKPSGSLAKGSTQASRCLFLYDRALRFARHSVRLRLGNAFQLGLATKLRMELQDALQIINYNLVCFYSGLSLSRLIAVMADCLSKRKLSFTSQQILK